MEANRVEYVGFWPRVAATLVDTVLMLAVLTPLIILLFGPDYFSAERAAPASAVLLIEWLLPAVAVLAFWIARQATPGKMLIGAEIVDADSGEKPLPGQFVLRYLGYYIAMLPLFLGILWVAFDRRKQGWHDKLSGTLVVRQPRSKMASDDT